MASDKDMALLINKSSTTEDKDETKTSTNTEANRKQVSQTNTNNDGRNSNESNVNLFKYANKMSVEEVYTLAKDFFKGMFYILDATFLYFNNQVLFL
jgi:hypothetical protein